MTYENEVFQLEDKDEVHCFFCLSGSHDKYRTYKKGEAFLAGARHSPCNGEANYVCRDHLESDAVIWPPEDIAEHTTI